MKKRTTRDSCKENTADKTKKQVDHERNCSPQAEESKSSLELPKKSSRGSARLSEPQPDSNRDKKAATRTGLKSHHISYTDIPAVNFISAPSAKPRRLLHIFLVALLAVALCLGVFWGHWSHAHSSNESLLLTKTGPNMLTPSLSSETGRDQLREHNLGSSDRSLVTHNTSQTFEERDHAFEPG